MNEHCFSADLTTVQAFHSSHQSLCVYVNMLKMRRFHVMMVIQSHELSSVMHISAMYRWMQPVICLLINVSRVYCEKMWLSVTLVCQCTVIEFLVKEKQLKYSDLCVFIDATSIRRWVTWNRDVRVHECVKTWCMVQIQWLVSWLMMMKTSTKKWITASSGMSCCPQRRRLELYCWSTGLWNSVDCILVDFWPKVGTISTAFFADRLYKLSCPLSENT